MKNKKRGISAVLVASVALPALVTLTTPETAHANDAVSVTLDSSTQKTIESSQLRVWLKSDGRYGIQLKSNGATIFYSQDSAYLNITRSGSFPNGLAYNQFSNLSLKSFVVNGTTIEQTRTDGTFDYIFRLSIVNATSQGAYMKAEVEMKNLTSASQLVGASFNIDTMVNGNDSSPFRIIPNGWEAFHNGVQVTAYYKDVFNVTNADSIYLGHYNNQYPMPISSFVNDQIIYPGDSGAGFYYNPKSVGAYQSRKESWIMGMGPRNVNPVFSLSAPLDNQTFYRGQTLQISGTASDTDVGDKLDVKWSVDGGAEKLISSFIANGLNQSFSQSYTLPNDLADGWHTLQVWVMDDKGGVSSSNTKRFFINNFTAPGTPFYQNVTNNGFTVSFDKKGNVDSTTYELQRIHNNSKVEMGTATSRVETGLLPNTKYDYAVRAKNTTNEYTAYSPTSSIYTLANQPTVGNLLTNVLGQATLTWNANGNPSGTKYSYEVRRVSDNVVVKNGETTSISAGVTGLPTDVRYKVYVKAINGDNKATAETYLGEILQDTVNPSLVLTKNTSDWTNGTVTLTANATDSGTGVKRIKLPDGNWVSSATANYVVSTNGTYSFEVEDNAGNVSVSSISVTNIDKEKPSSTHTVEHVDGDTYKITVNGSDNVSGVKRIKLPGGQHQNGTTATFNGLKGQSYTFEVEDNAGNVLSYNVKISSPDLNVYQKENHVKAEWAIEMLDEDVLNRTGFEVGEELPTNLGMGGQSITTEDSFTGSRSFKIENTVSNGNWYQFPATSSNRSLTYLDKKYFPNGTDLSISFKAKSDVGGVLMPNGDGGWGETINTLPNKVAVNVSSGTNKVQLDTLTGITLGGYVTFDTDPKVIRVVHQIRAIDPSTNTITLNTNVYRNLVAGENLKSRPWRGAWSFNQRNVPGNNEWTNFSINTKVFDFADYDVAVRGGSFYIGSQTAGKMYVDDLKFGFATKSQLFRGSTKVYEGLLSDYEDKVATDKAKPEKVSDVNVRSESGSIVMDITKPKDNGTEYDYTVRALSNKGDWVESERKRVTVTSDIEGYSYVVDTNPGTIPDNTVDSRSEKAQISVASNVQHYIHIKSIDKAGNVSDVSHIPFRDATAPILNLSQNPTTWTAGIVTIQAEATDETLDVKRIQLPSGVWQNGATASYTVTENGTYTFVAEDLVGNKTTKSITVTNIDKTNPTAPIISNNNEWVKADSMSVSIQAGTDAGSGVKRVEYRLEGATSQNWTTYTGVFSVKNEGETKISARTIDNVGFASSETTSYVRLDRSAPHNMGITIKLKP